MSAGIQQPRSKSSDFVQTRCGYNSQGYEQQPKSMLLWKRQPCAFPCLCSAPSLHHPLTIEQRNGPIAVLFSSCQSVEVESKAKESPTIKSCVHHDLMNTSISLLHCAVTSTARKMFTLIIFLHLLEPRRAAVVFSTPFCHAFSFALRVFASYDNSTSEGN